MRPPLATGAINVLTVRDESSTSQVYTKATGAASEAITHTQGPEAAQVAQKAGETTENAGSVAKDVFLGTSAMEHARVAGLGAVQKD